MKFEKKNDKWTICEECFCEYGRPVQKFICGIYGEEYKTVTYYNICYACAEKRVKNGKK